jgi:hypothetical protein
VIYNIHTLEDKRVNSRALSEGERKAGKLANEEERFLVLLWQMICDADLSSRSTSESGQ